MKTRLRTGAAILAAFIVGQLNPVGFAYWKIAEWWLPRVRIESLSHPTPFESIPGNKWLGETKDAFAFNDINHDAPVHILLIPKERFNTILGSL